MIMLLVVLVRVAWIISTGAFRKFLPLGSFSRRYRQINFYLLMAGINISGYLISASAGRAVKIFSFANFPALLSLKKGALEFVITLHYYLAYGSVILILVHAFITHRPRVLSRFRNK